MFNSLSYGTTLINHTTTQQQNPKLPNVLVIGIGEYVTGYVHESASQSDKPIGVVLLTLFDLRRRGKIHHIYLAGTQGTKFTGIRNHLKRGLSRYNFEGNTIISGSRRDEHSEEALSVVDEYLTETFPADSVEKDIHAYREGLKRLNKGDVVFIFTPDHTHYEIALECINSGMHVLVAKPLVQKLEHHYELINAIRKENVLVGVEVHKRWDPIYSDARDRILNQDEIGDFSYFSSYMSQPSSQLITFKNWASHSDISYYLNSHHIDFHCWALNGMETRSSEKQQRFWRPYRVFASGSYGVANSEPFNINTEDSITLTVQWVDLSSKICENPSKDNSAENFSKCLKGTAVYTSSWVAPKKSDVHSQQRFMYQGSKGEITVDQAHRGYTVASDAPTSLGLRSINPLFMKYSPDVFGRFSGQNGYGYLSLSSFVECVYLYENSLVTDLNLLKQQLPSVDVIQHSNTTENDCRPAMLSASILTTAILEAGRISLNKQLEGKFSSGDVVIHYNMKTLLPTHFE
ncbi:hypothetical protein FDP41_007728 [Naegleria fowleri]|uniref:Gfo/Idh/MocA-like oxidoreductase N-terminal domain-containing protein n=1 Tax=Naegleria fowleri TaxID=5763 RepID=A0A6A5C069_NAEFO|nr:uncharacterized protein FDP41_007728 [Naegleria fowleri]KAF0983813.1 hypothetical protein FDP41_007728 [Naegleria fowleri]CAG4717512.1 unnamed protein product [Naegleria fowleri]